MTAPPTPQRPKRRGRSWPEWMTKEPPSRPPTPTALADRVHDLEDRLRTHGRTVEERLAVYAATGYPARVIGVSLDTDSRPSPAIDPDDPDDGALATLTVVEAAAIHGHQFRDKDRLWRWLLWIMFRLADRLIRLIDSTMAAADPDAPRVEKLGTSCVACTDPISRIGEDRPKRGLCPPCHRTWLNWGRPDIAEFAPAIVAYRAEQARTTERIDPQVHAAGNADLAGVDP